MAKSFGPKLISNGQLTPKCFIWEYLVFALQSWLGLRIKRGIQLNCRVGYLLLVFTHWSRVRSQFSGSFTTKDSIYHMHYNKWPKSVYSGLRVKIFLCTIYGPRFKHFLLLSDFWIIFNFQLQGVSTLFGNLQKSYYAKFVLVSTT